MFDIIVATDTNNGIGYQNRLPWRNIIEMQRYATRSDGLDILQMGQW